MLDTLQKSKKFFLVCLIFLVLLTACGNTDVKTSKASLPPAESNIDTSLKAPNWVE
ncbi:CapA family protein, partial [Bacillus cereus]